MKGTASEHCSRLSRAIIAVEKILAVLTLVALPFRVWIRAKWQQEPAPSASHKYFGQLGDPAD